MATDGTITRLKINDGSEKIYSIGGEGGGGSGPSGGSIESTLLSANWIEDGSKYYQIIDNVTDMQSSIIPIVDIRIPSTSTEENTTRLLSAWSYIYSAESSNNRVIIYSYNKPDIDLDILIKWYGGGSGGSMPEVDVDNKIKQAIDALEVTLGGASTNKTVTSLSQTSGKISATFNDISITKSQISDFPEIPTQTAVKGDAETVYRTGDVNLTAANIGAAPVSHTHTKSQITDLLGTMQYLGSNITGGSSNDTRTFWQGKGTGYAWFSTNNQLNGQPDQYGFLLNYVIAYEVFQIFLAQNNNREISMRGANASVSAMPSFYKQWSSAKFDFGTSTTTYLRNDGTWGIPAGTKFINPSSSLVNTTLTQNTEYSWTATADCVVFVGYNDWGNGYVKVDNVEIDGTSSGTKTLCFLMKKSAVLKVKKDSSDGLNFVRIFGIKA